MNNKPEYSEAISESIFVAIPILALIIIRLMQGKFIDILQTSDYSLATSIMYGQLLAKTLSVPEHKKKTGRFQLFQVITLAISLLSIVMYTGFQLIENISVFFYIIQAAIFITGIFFYIPTLTLINTHSRQAKNS